MAHEPVVFDEKRMERLQRAITMAVDVFSAVESGVTLIEILGAVNLLQDDLEKSFIKHLKK